MAELAPLSILITADADDLKAELAAAKTAIAKFEAQATKGGKGVKTLGTSMNNAGLAALLASNRSRMFTQQLSQVAQQSTATGQVVQAFAIQAADIGMLFGTVGTVVGALAGIALPSLVSAINSAMNSTGDFKGELEGLEGVLSDIESAQSLLDLSTEDLTKRFGDQAVVVRQLAQNLAEYRVGVARDALRESADFAQMATEQFSRLSVSAAAAAEEIAILEQQGTAFAKVRIDEITKDINKEAERMGELFGISADQALVLSQAFANLGAAETTAEMNSELAELNSLMDELGISAEVIPDELSEAIARMSELGILTAEVEAAMHRAASAAAGIGPLDAFGGPGPFVASGFGPQKEPGKRRGGGGGGRAAKDTTEAELEKLQQLLMSKEELEIASFERQQQLLQESLEKKLITQEEYNALMEDAQARHAQRMAAVYSAQGDSALATTLGSASDVLSAMGAFNDKAFKLAKVAGAAQALVSTLQGSAEALKLPYPLNLAAAASVMAKGLGLVAAIKGVSGGGAGGSASAATGALAADPVQPGQNIVIDFKGDTFSKQGGIALIESINDALRDGGKIDGILAR